MSATDMTNEMGYISPLASRNASPEMQFIWSMHKKHSTWRRLWLVLAEAQMELGLDIKPGQIEEMRSHIDDIDFDKAAVHESRLRHDVMAHIHTFGEAAPTALPIIHMGATSQFVNCNTELVLMREALDLIAVKIASVISSLITFAVEYKSVATLGFTHYQPAQPTTVGKRAVLWAYDFVLALEEIEYRFKNICLRGVKGATGTQASFLRLFNGDSAKVERLDELVVEKMGFRADQRYAVTGQTYPRLVDAQILNSLATVAAAIHKMCNDIRLLANRKEIEEPFGDTQVGSSAMPYKRNPMRCERATGLARFVISLAPNGLNTAATQWFERTLDDSANRRLSLPESFLALDGALDLVHNVTSGLVVYEKTILDNLMSELPFMVSENILMAAVSQGANRQEAHEIIRRHSQEAGYAVKYEGKKNDLLERLQNEPMFCGLKFDDLLDPLAYVGLARQQVDKFVDMIGLPVRQRYAGRILDSVEPQV